MINLFEHTVNYIKSAALFYKNNFKKLSRLKIVKDKKNKEFMTQSEI